MQATSKTVNETPIAPRCFIFIPFYPGLGWQKVVMINETMLRVLIESLMFPQGLPWLALWQ
jgi:hypothetical protein